MRVVELEKMNTKSYVEAGFDTAIFPIGACESHGDHMPFGTDALTAHALSIKVAQQCKKTLVLPPHFLGMSQHYRHKPMCISLSSDTQIRVIQETLESLVHWGIKKVLILNGHDGNIPCAEIAARTVKVSNPGVSLAIFDWWTILGKMVPQGTFEVWSGWGHAGKVETSIGIALFPELMRMDQARGQIPTRIDEFVKEIWTFDEITAEGATGAAHKATPEKGALIVKTVVQYLIKYMQDFEEHGLKFNPVDARVYEQNKK